jgi:hypothetical protein
MRTAMVVGNARLQVQTELHLKQRRSRLLEEYVAGMQSGDPGSGQPEYAMKVTDLIASTERAALFTVECRMAQHRSV